MADIKVLYVEDAKSSGGSLRQALKENNAGISAVFLGGAFDCLDEIAEEGADAVVACIELGDLPGYELASLIKSCEATQYMPVILWGMAGSKVDPYWHNASLCDAYYSDAQTRDAKGIRDIVESIQGLVEESRKKGFEKEKSRGLVVTRPEYSSSKAVDSARKLIEELLLEKAASALARRMSSKIDDRQEMLDIFFAGAQKSVEADLIGLLVLSHNPNNTASWGAFQSRDGSKLTTTHLTRMVERLTLQLELKKEPQIESRGQFSVSATPKDAKDSKDSKEKESAKDKELGSIQVVPIAENGQTMGAVVVASKERNAFSDQALAYGEFLGRELRPTVRLILAQEAISDLISREAYRASIDSLTGLYNLEFLVGFLQQQLLFSFRQRLPVAVAIVDIDGFSKVNGDFGYEFGDGALMTIANRLLNITRSSDLIARYGGDQFAVVLPNTDVVGARVLAEKVRTEVENIDFAADNVQGGKTPKMTVSVGCASFNMEDLNPETILRDAKVALRRAKDDGRNRIASL